jgi:uncharacterized membrane protein YkvI
MIFHLFEGESVKHRFIGKYILPLYEPAVEYFSQYGIESGTVHVVPTLIVVLIYVIILAVKRETKSFEFKVYLFGIIVLVLGIIDAQFFSLSLENFGRRK